MGCCYVFVIDDEDECGKKEVWEVLIYVFIKFIIFIFSFVIVVFFILYFSFLYI